MAHDSPVTTRGAQAVVRVLAVEAVDLGMSTADLAGLAWSLAVNAFDLPEDVGWAMSAYALDVYEAEKAERGTP